MITKPVSNNCCKPRGVVMPNPVYVIDADYNEISDTIVVRYQYGENGKLDRTVMTGYKYWAWLPDCLKDKYDSLYNYWNTIHPHVRDAHISDYMLDDADLYNSIKELAALPLKQAA